MGNIIANANIKELIEKIYASQYSSHLNDFTKRCLNKYEDRANLNELQNTKFYVKYKTEANNKVVKDFISEYVVSMGPCTSYIYKGDGQAYLMRHGFFTI